MALRKREVCIDTVKCYSIETNSPKPTENVYSVSDVARDQHDIFNLVALIPVVVLTIVNWDPAKFIQGNIEEAWLGHFFPHLWLATFAYFGLDLWWVIRVPICVKSPRLIVKHHIIAMIYLVGPIIFPEFQWFMGLIISVEINTWFLIARRAFVYRREIPQLLSDIITGCFYLSWVAIRCIIYPGLLAIFLKMAHEGILRTQSIWHIQLLFVPVHACLVALNFKWTYDLFLPIINRCFSADPGCRASRISSGL